MDKKNRNGIILNLVSIVLFLFVLTFLTVKYYPYITRLAGSPDEFVKLLNSYGYKSGLVFIAFQVLQVVIAIIPGEVIQIAGGYVFGTFLGSIYSITGIFLGSVIAFYISRVMGYRLVRKIISPQKIKKFDRLMNSSKSEIAVFVLFLLPGLPKDILTYIAGITPIMPVKFFALAMAGRLPSLLATSFIGSNIYQKDYAKAIIVSVIAFVLFIGGVLLKDRIIKLLRGFTHGTEK